MKVLELVKAGKLSIDDAIRLTKGNVKAAREFDAQDEFDTLRGWDDATTEVYEDESYNDY